jgi:hypothetical protein
MWPRVNMSVPGCVGARGVGFGVGGQRLELFDQYSDRLLIGAHFAQLARVVMEFVSAVLFPPRLWRRVLYKAGRFAVPTRRLTADSGRPR